MHAELIKIREHLQIKDFVTQRLSFCPFVAYLQHRIETEKTIKAEFYRFVLNKFKLYPELQAGGMEPESAANYSEILELIYTILSPTIEDEQQLYWALANPMRSTIVYSTDAFFRFAKQNQNNAHKRLISDAAYKRRQTEFVYRLILQKLYNFPADLTDDHVYALPDEKTKIIKYYRVHADTRFVDIKASAPLPALTAEMMEPFLYEGADMAVLKQMMPLSMFTLEGFTIISIEDITTSHALEAIRLALINNTAGQAALYTEVINSLKTLAGNAAVHFGLVPFIRVNGKLIFDTYLGQNNLLLTSAQKYNTDPVHLKAFIDDYVAKPEALFFTTVTEKKAEKFPFLKPIKQANVASYAILPVFYNRQQAGMLEIYADQRVVFNQKLLSRIQAAIPLLAQLLHNTAEQFHEQMQGIIKTNFTTLQPSVEWRFNEAAWRYLVEQQNTEKPEMEVISFSDVHPLYGAIDIRDSTIKHNAALKNDIKTLTSALTQLTGQLKQHLPKRVSVSLTNKQKAWLKKIKEFEKSNDETLLKNFLQGTINPFFATLGNKYQSTAKLINDFDNIVGENGAAFNHRRALETSVKLINKTLSRYFEQAQPKLQKIYPCYFEKFRSDGIEYDIYTGPTIAPHIPFEARHLSNFRLWQLKAMIDVANLTHNLLPKMPVKLQTAALIFVHSSKIDICFRNDERRFDVEGYYNIRYEVIKKRIDKVHVKGTKERLTQPGKIALVYFNDNEAAEYIALIKTFQKDKALKKDLEFVELENLQGVTGLKALRVSVNY